MLPTTEIDESNRHERRALASSTGRTLAAMGLQVPEILARLHQLPPGALLTPEEAALYLNTNMELLRAWRWRGVGPEFVGRHRFTRYRKGSLDAFLTGQDQGEAA